MHQYHVNKYVLSRQLTQCCCAARWIPDKISDRVPDDQVSNWKSFVCLTSRYFSKQLQIAVNELPKLLSKNKTTEQY